MKKTHRVLRHHKLDGLFLTEWKNIYYTSGYWCTASVVMKDSPPLAVIVNSAGDTAIVLSQTYKGWSEGTHWAHHVCAYGNTSEFGNAIKEALSDMGLKGAKIGADLGTIQAKFSKAHLDSIRSPYYFIDGMKNTALLLGGMKNSGANFVDGAAAIWDLRMIKSKLEVERVRKAAEAASKAAEQAFERLRVGMTEEDVHRLLFTYMMEEGASSPGFADVQSGEKFRKGLAGSFPSMRKIRRGDFVDVDLGATYRQYGCDIHRIAKLGAQLTSAEKDHWNLYVEANKEACRAIKPGATVASVYAAEAKVFEEAGLKLGMVAGHGLGLDTHEPPAIARDNKSLIKAGMVLSVEPFGVPSKDGVVFNCEDNVVCTETGCERLSTIKREIFVV